MPQPENSKSRINRNHESIAAVIGFGRAVVIPAVFVLSSVAVAQSDQRAAQIAEIKFIYDGTPPEALVELGRTLFFDPILSGNRNISCGTCHHPALGSGDGLALGIGEGGTGVGPERRTQDGVIERVPRNAQPLWNIGATEYVSMFHDGRLEPDPRETFPSGFWSPAREDLPSGLDSLLAAQAMFPVTSPTEMAGQKGENAVATAVAEDRLGDAWDILAKRLASNQDYAAQFASAFTEIEAPGDISFVHVANALAAFQTVAFRSDESPFDLALRAGDISHMSGTEQEGFRLFYGKAGCVTCHSGPLLTDHEFHAIGMPQIGPGKGHGSDSGYWRASGFMDRLEDEGRYRVTFDPEDMFAFRTPSLRNVALTGPWGHDGAFDKLEDVVRHHLDPLMSLAAYDLDTTHLPALDQVIERTGQGSQLIFRPLNPARRGVFDLRDGWVQTSKELTARISDEVEIMPVALTDTEVNQILAFLDTLTDPSAVDRGYLIPDVVPSGLMPQPSRDRKGDAQ
ncbi:cytochrome-c peroxidase [Roseobacter sp. EG26]|uniref:cytochrome-c peroxidase n=1 Tax=Roseobacter sp. EG26 TaxID=3412477 RepID=UPI003CE48CC7